MKFLKGKWKAKYTLQDSREQGLNKLHECEDLPLSIYHIKILNCRYVSEIYSFSLSQRTE